MPYFSDNCGNQNLNSLFPFYISRIWSSFDEVWKREIGAAIRLGFSASFLIVADVFGASKNKNLALTYCGLGVADEVCTGEERQER